ncbi:hypothetical protein Nepgr_032350 [Nepenthes gracilis]|uniref:Protein LNK2 n=1 Tax=Nepenthes gracilis TaxID=150966 RepID=A0AAD3Y5K9_NEPGR|nr:hypothetical protein Nepgr_032350 [Nepenthes gracilis]
MFDWDDQEIANVIWGEASEADDHLVPYPEEIEKKPLPTVVGHGTKEFNSEAMNSKTSEQKTHATKSNSQGDTPRNNDIVSAIRVVIDPQPDSSPFVASKTCHNGIAVNAEVQNGMENSERQQEDIDLGEILDDSWANIGSFDDLDRIFSTDDVVGCLSLDSTQEFWSSSRDVISDAEKSSSAAQDSRSWTLGASGDTSGHFEINAEYCQGERTSFNPGCGKIDDSTSYSRQNLCARLDQVEHTFGTTASLLNEKTTSKLHLAAEKVATPNKSLGKNWSKNKSKHGDNANKASNLRLPSEMYVTQTAPAVPAEQCDSQCAPETMQNFPSSFVCEQRLSPEFGSLGYQYFSNPYVASCAYRSFTHQYTAIPLLQLTDNEHQSALSSSEASPHDAVSLSNSVEPSAKPHNMTLQEKIEKLRGRQKMRAILAIQKQQQQLSHQVSGANFSITFNGSQVDQILDMGKTSIPVRGNMSSLCIDRDFTKLDDLITTSLDVQNVEDTVLHQLQDIIDKLDVRIRLCVRDSLFRLAHNATQRQYTSDTNSTNRSSACKSDVGKGEIRIHDRFSGTSNVETKTNHVDRAVAHLLFHQHS